MFEYLIWLFIFVITPISILYYFFRKILKHYKKIFIGVAFFSVLFSVFWDVAAVGMGTWYFPAEKNLGITILNFPFEEIFFMIFISILISMITVIVRYKK